MIFQQDVFSLHKKPSSFLWRWIPGWLEQAGEDRHGMLGFYLGAGDEEDDLAMQRFRTKIFWSQLKRVASEMGRRGRREAVEALGLTKQEAKQKPPRRWRKPFQCLDQCCNFSCGFSIMCSRKFGGSYRCAPGYWGHHHTHFLCQGEGWCVDVEWKLSTEFWGKMSEIYVQLYPICSTYGNIYLHLP